ncbi:MAG: hypothetical protein A2W91_14305 [Bacteroidetes bacterium GWF2_38_335]|nr:MAG: hypothetical protein A2W91_14305 [Bacteroidetes bacterium GWF2_38_335]OFY79367.1 MAG: hypothetical protein A2281_16850 [Bacteroidetes bacterium RIFOXYA12_FULL_38_20]HBS85628.1 Crp/Fnr family transcriptional regulator [Bacteroidales bacterium]
MKPISEGDSEFICDIQAPCFQTLTPEETELIKAGKTQVLFRKGDNLTKQGAFASYVLFMIKGVARQYVEGDNNKTYNLKIISPGEFIGLSSVFNKNTFTYSSVALTDSHVFLIEKDVIAKVVKSSGGFAYNIIRRYCEANDRLYKNLNMVVFKQMNGRLAETLLYLNSFRRTFPDIFKMLSRKEIADFAGISTESTVKLLKSLEVEKVVSLVEKDIIITDEAKLVVISKNG